MKKTKNLLPLLPFVSLFLVGCGSTGPIGSPLWDMTTSAAEKEEQYKAICYSNNLDPNDLSKTKYLPNINRHVNFYDCIGILRSEMNASVNQGWQNVNNAAAQYNQSINSSKQKSSYSAPAIRPTLVRETVLGTTGNKRVCEYSNGQNIIYSGYCPPFQ